MDAESALELMGGIARWKALHDVGVRAGELARAVAAGSVFRPGHGIYALQGIALEVTAAVRAGASLGCVSAAQSHGLWVHRQHGLHLSAPRSVLDVRYGRVHRLRQAYGPVVPLEVCLRQVMACLPLSEALVIAESAVVKSLVTVEDLHRLSAGRGSRRAGLVIEAINPGSESAPETLARHALQEAGYTVVSQRRIDGVGRVDLEVEGRLLLEIDGRAHHSDEQSFTEDRRRWNELTIKGLDLLVVPAKQVLAYPRSILVPVRRYFAERGDCHAATSAALAA
ncbi:hypothetical protein ACWF5H_07530 [Arthrobacter sp. NPDC055138]